jgi:peptidoglycan L-alanyl-D-glutamate endopeptidase CwlK
MSRALNDLDSRLRPIAFEHIARCIEAKVPVMIIDTLRTHEEQVVNVASGVSWTMNSKHLPQSPENKALAYDLAPYSVYQSDGPDKLNWDENHPTWQIIGNIGLSLNLKWGVIKNNKRIDLGHFEYV